MASRFYKLTYNTNNKLVHAVINLYTVSRIERCEKNIRIVFNSSVFDKPQVIYLTCETDKECDEMYAGIENAMNPINKLA